MDVFVLLNPVHSAWWSAFVSVVCSSGQFVVFCAAVRISA
jgi:hypothetical protein